MLELESLVKKAQASLRTSPRRPRPQPARASAVSREGFPGMSRRRMPGPQRAGGLAGVGRSEGPAHYWKDAPASSLRFSIVFTLLVFLTVHLM